MKIIYQKTENGDLGDIIMEEPETIEVCNFYGIPCAEIRICEIRKQIYPDCIDCAYLREEVNK